MPTEAIAGLRATYGIENEAPVVIEMADNGDLRTELDPHRILIVRGGEGFVVTERLTGALVTRVADLEALAARRRPAPRSAGAPAGRIVVENAGTQQVNGRTGRAFAIVLPGVGNPSEVDAVISDEPALAPLGPAMRSIHAARTALYRLEPDDRGDAYGETAAERRILGEGAPLLFYGMRLRTVEPAALPPERFALPAEPEPRVALVRRLREEAREDDDPNIEQQMIVRAVFAAGRLWLLTDDGSLSSLAESETRRTRHDPRGPVLDICVADGALLAVPGRRSGGSTWTVRRREDNRWRTVRRVSREQDRLVALSCATPGAMLLTNRRIFDLGANAPVRLSASIERFALRTVVHVTGDSVFLGFNRGEWGGGVQRIDRRTGRVERIERNLSGDGCDGPLNTDCDPVNGLATVPWRPDCIAAAIGLVHFMAHGRITQICPGSVEQMVAVRDRVDPEDAERIEEADKGGYGSIAFFGLTARADRLLAAGHDGLYRIGPDGATLRQGWPRFVEVDGVYVSFALPDAVLVLTQLNRRASVSGASPLLVPR